MLPVLSLGGCESMWVVASLLCCHVLFSCVQPVPSPYSLSGVAILLIGSFCLQCVAGH